MEYDNKYDNTNNTIGAEYVLYYGWYDCSLKCYTGKRIYEHRQ